MKYKDKHIRLLPKTRIISLKQFEEGAIIYIKQIGHINDLPSTKDGVFPVNELAEYLDKIAETLEVKQDE